MSKSLAWTLLLAAGALEIVWVIFMRFSDGFTRLWPSVGVVASGGISILLAAQAVRVLPIGTAYAVWTGIGAAGAVVLGIILFHESRDPARLFFLVLLLTALVGLRMTANAGG